MKKSSALFVLCIFFMSLSVFAELKFNSLPGAQATIFLDFDGHHVTTTLWNDGKPLDCAPAGMNDAQLTEVYNRVSEDYRPFNVNITTDSATFLQTPLTKRIRLIITTTSAWWPGVGGVAFPGAFTWADEPIKLIHIERSADGTYFKGLTAVNTQANKFTCSTITKEDIFYRLKTVSPAGETACSNVIVLKSTAGRQKPFAISATGNNDIIVNASKYYSYKLCDTNGRIIAHGANPAGIHNININNKPRGIYIMNIVNQNECVTEKIVRQ